MFLLSADIMVGVLVALLLFAAALIVCRQRCCFAHYVDDSSSLDLEVTALAPDSRHKGSSAPSVEK